MKTFYSYLILTLLFIAPSAQAYAGLGPLVPLAGSILAAGFIVFIIAGGFILLPLKIAIQYLRKKFKHSSNG